MYTRWGKTRITLIHIENNIITNKNNKNINSVFHELTTVSLFYPTLYVCKHCLHRLSIYLSSTYLSICGSQVEFLREGDIFTEFQKEKSYIRQIKKETEAFQSNYRTLLLCIYIHYTYTYIGCTIIYQSCLLIQTIDFR